MMTALLWVGLGLIAIYLGICLLLWALQRRIIFEPHYQPKNPLPDDLAIAYEKIQLATGKDKTGTIVGWWFPNTESQGKTALLLHGNSGYEASNFKTLEILNELGFAVLMINYRGYGESTNLFPSEERVYEDASAAYEFLCNQKQVNPKNLLIYGHSLGGAIAIELATRYDCAGLFIEATFASMLEMSVTKTYMKFLPINWILNQRFDSRQKIPSIKKPIFFCHGIQDETVPSFMSERLMAIANEPKRLELIQTADHYNLANVGEETVRKGIQWLTAFIVSTP